jgi:hypothetical protein
VIPQSLSRGRTALAILLSVLLIATGSLGATPAQAADGPAIDVSLTSVSEAGGIELRVAGSGFGEATGAYGALIEKGTESAVTASGGYVAFGYWATPGAITGGVFEKTLAAPTSALDKTKSYEVIVWQSHALPDATTIYARADVPLTAADLDTLFPAPAPAPAPAPTPTETPTETPTPTPTPSTPPVPTLTLSKSAGLDPAGEQITVRGSGYNPAQSLYLTTCTDVPLAEVSFAFISAGCTTGAKLISPNPRTATQVKLNADGTFETAFTVSPKSGSTAVYTIADHTAQADRSQDAKVTVTFAKPAPTLTVSKTQGLNPAGETLTVTATNYDGPAASKYTPGKAGFYLQVGWIAQTWRPSEGAPSSARANAYSTWAADGANTMAPTKWTENADGTVNVSWTIDVTKDALFAKKLDSSTLAVFTLGAGGVMQPGNEQAVPIAFDAATPTLTVSKTEGLNPDGETLTIRGAGYDGSAASKYGPGKAGFYIQAGWLADTWRPSAGAASSARTNAYSTWVADAANTVAPTKWTVAPDGTVSFEWTVTIDRATLEAKRLPGGTLAVFTTGAGGVTQAGNERAVPITFAGTPLVTAAVTDASAVLGLSVKADATNLGSAAGAYVALIEKGAEGNVTTSGGYAAMVYATGISAGAVSKTLVAAPGKLDRTKQYEVIVWKQHTLPTPSTIYARTDVRVTEAQWNAVFPSTTPPVVTPPVVTPPAEQPASVAGGSLAWGVSTSFVQYIRTTAHGSVILSGGATEAGSRFQFGQAAGSTFDGSVGAVSYIGSVRFTGHGGALDVTLSNPSISFTSPTTASLFLTSGGRQVEFATLNVQAGSRSTANGAVTFAGVPASLTAAGQSQVLAGFGTQLDPLTFTIGSPAAAPAGATGTVVVAARAAAPRTLPSTPPSTTGIEVDDETLAALQSGAQATVSASGFRPGEEGISVVVYSTPTLLGTVDADANGVATWTGVLPATLEDGVHTLTFQGSVSRGIQFTLSRAAALSAGGECTVADASLNWGFKESFRTYIEGIAAGGWELSDVVYEYPQYVWSNGTGSLDLDGATGLVGYGGVLTFTGHEGALNTTLSNARIELAGDTGYLVLDVSGTTQAGEAVTQSDVRFAEFDVPELALTDGAISLEALPATLTDAGSAAFGTYEAGEELDPVSAVIPVDADCGVMATQAGEEAETVVTPVSDEASTETGAPVWPWIVGILVIVAAAGIITIVLVRRRSRTPDQG